MCVWPDIQSWIGKMRVLREMVIVIENGIVDQSSNPGQGCSHFT